MNAIITAREWNIRRDLARHAADEGWDVSPRLLGRIAKIAALAGDRPRPSDPPPRATAGGRRRAGKGAGRPSAGRGGVPASSEALGVSAGFQRPAVARVAPVSPVTPSQSPSERRNGAEGRISRPLSPQAVTEPHSASAPARLLHLIDRAADGRLLPAEAQLLRDGIQQLAKEARHGA